MPQSVSQRCALTRVTVQTRSCGIIDHAMEGGRIDQSFLLAVHANPSDLLYGSVATVGWP